MKKGSEDETGSRPDCSSDPGGWWRGHMAQTPAGPVVGQTAATRTEPRNHQPGASSQPAEEDGAAEPSV